MSLRSIVDDLDRRDALELARSVAEKHGVTLADLLGRSRKARPTRARHELWSRLYDDAIPTLSALGRVFERDHTTIRAGVRKHARELTCKASPNSPSGSERSDNACTTPS
jgi:chromosomal replication initiation ATPase DnaA